MSGLRSALEELEAEDLATVPAARQEEDFAELQRAQERLELELLRRLAALQGHGIHAGDGHLSMVSWLSDRFRMAPAEAARDAGAARALQDMAPTRQAVVAGEVSLSAARVLVDAQRFDREAFARSEEVLLEAARRHRVSDLKRAVAYWRNAVMAERSSEGADPSFDRRGLHVSPTVFGMVRIDGTLDPECGETVLTALRAVVDADGNFDHETGVRSGAQRQADALGTICRHWLASSDRPELGGERPHVTLTVDVQTLAGGGGNTVCQLDHTGPVPRQTALRVACDASIARVMMGGRSEPLDVGRRTPVVPAPMRRAVVVRDRHCRFPGCDRPPSWSDCHHVVHWAHGGATSVSNLILLCRRHHGLVHDRGRFRVEMIAGRPVFYRPNGAVLEERAPP